MTTKKKNSLTLANMNPCIKKMEYAVRGPLVIRANEILEELAKGCSKNFNCVIKANIGDCHATGQKPITFIRQLLACITYPPLLDDPKIPIDVKDRACAILKSCRGCSVGSYTESVGIDLIRQHVADFIVDRDGYSSNQEDIVLANGASDAIKSVLKLMIQGDNKKQSGVMVPIPQYPLYSATLAEFNMYQINYYLDECRNWGLDIFELQRAIGEAREHCIPRAIVVINPGNPTGQVLTKENIREIIQFAYCENLFILADEVYQHNIHDERSQFHSFKKVMMEMGEPFCHMELASFMSCSKGYMGECGLRGGYAEVINLDREVKKMYLKSISAMLCPTVIGQATIDCIVNAPKMHEPSYDLFIREKDEILYSLKVRAKLVEDAFNRFPGMSCNPVMGAMYAFPSINFTRRAIVEAESRNQSVDTMYAFELLENTGICIVPGSGFGQRLNTYHFRTTILPQLEDLKQMLALFEEFHVDFMNRYC